MKDLNECKFSIPKSKVTQDWLERNHFSLSSIFSDNDEKVYYKRIIVWHYGNAGILDAEIDVNQTTGNVRVDCFDYGSRAFYASWYCRKYGKNDVVTQIDNTIRDELKRLGIKIIE